MISLTLDTWVSLAVLVTALAGLYAALRREIRAGDDRLELRIDAVETKLGTRIDSLDIRVDGLDTKIDRKVDSLRDELKADIGRLEDRIQGLDDRVYALATGLRPLVERAEHVD